MCSSIFVSVVVVVWVLGNTLNVVHVLRNGFLGIPNSYEVSMPEEYGLLVLLVWHIKCVAVRYLESSSKGAGRGIKPNKIKNHIFSKERTDKKKIWFEVHF